MWPYCQTIRLLLRIDDHDPVVLVVVDRDVPVREHDREGGMVELSPARRPAVAPEDAAVVIEDESGARPRVVGEKNASAGRVAAGRTGSRPAPGRTRAAFPSSKTRRPTNRRISETSTPPFGSGVSPLTAPSVRGGLWTADPSSARSGGRSALADEEDAAVVRVRDGQRPVGQDVRVVGPVEVVARRPRIRRLAEEIGHVRWVLMLIARMSWLSSSFVTSSLPPGTTNVSSSKKRWRPLASVGPGREAPEDASGASRRGGGGCCRGRR